MSNVTTKSFRPLSELNLLDDFLFQEMLAQVDIREEFCRILLKTILGKPIRRVRITPQKNVLGIDTKSHGIRLDAYIQDVSDIVSSDAEGGDTEVLDADIIPDIYDVEPNKHFEKMSLPKRMRYYHGLIDTQLLSTGTAYARLPNVVIIFILPYDPFDRNRMVYTIKNQCIEVPDLAYEDGARKIILYTKGKLTDAPEGTGQALRDMLKYMEKSTKENVTNSDLETIHHLVSEVKARKEVGINYMKSWELEEMYREEGMQRGLEEGREIGREIGREEGLAEGRAEGREEGIRILITTCREFQMTKEDILSKLTAGFSIDMDTAQKYLDTYWN